MKKGIDISKWQGNIDFKAVKNSGIEFVIIREGYRKQTDPRFLEYVQSAKESGFIILGVYHFMYSRSEEDAKMEADSTIRSLREAGIKPGEVIVFSDYEHDTVKDAKEAGIILTKDDCNKHVQAFCSVIEKSGFKAGIYTNLDYHRHYYTAETLGMYPIWLADYTDGPDFTCVVQQYTNKGSVPGISGNVDMNYYYGDFKMDNDVKYSRQKVVDLVLSWIGKNERDGSYKEIIDTYNSFDGPFPRGVRMQYGWAWCACTWSALAVALGYTDVMPIEISCDKLIERAKEMGIWIEDDSYRPLPGDAVLYDWDDNGVGDNKGWPDHVGTVVKVSDKQLSVVEGNKSDAVGIRTIDINGKYIRGFIAPKFKDEEILPLVKKPINEIVQEVLAGLWGNGNTRKDALTIAGYDYNEIQNNINEIVKAQHKEKILHAACRTILGEYGTGEARRKAIENLGLEYLEVQNLVNMFVEISKE